MRIKVLVVIASILLAVLVGTTSVRVQANTSWLQSDLPVGNERIGVSGTPLIYEQAKLLLTQFQVRPLTLEELKLDGRVTYDERMGKQVALAPEVETFWAWNFVTEEFYEVTANLEHTSDHAYFYVEEGQSVSNSVIESLANEFDDHIYDPMHQYFGNESNIDSDDRVFFLLLDIQDGNGFTYTAGYFHPIDLMPDNGNSNKREMMYVDTDPGDPSSDFTVQVLAHEFQHLVHFNYDKDEETWINEGLSNLAVNLLGYGHPMQQVNAFRNNPDTNLTAWDHDDSLKHYGATYLWMLYLYEQFPGSTTNPLSKQLVAEGGNGIAGIETVLTSAGYDGNTFNTIFPNWAIANSLNNRGVDTRWGYQDLSFNMTRHTVNYIKDPITIGDGSQPSPISEHASDNDRVRFLNPFLLKQTFRATFEGDENGTYSFFAISDNQVVEAQMEPIGGMMTGETIVAPGLFGSINYIVSRADDNAVSGDYQIDVEPIENIVFVVDDTGSMSNEISSVKQTIAEKINEFAAEDKEYLYTLITFKDYVNNRGSTADPEEIKGWVQALDASGGGDCPESSYQALQEAAASVKGGHVWIMTDASSHGTLADALATAYKLLDSGLKLHSVVLGDCGTSLLSHDSNTSANGKVESNLEQSVEAYSSEFDQISQSTGGHFFRVTSAEISIAMETVLNEMASNSYINWISLDASSLSPYEVTLDAGTEKVGFLLNTYSGTSSLIVERPDGSTVEDSDPDATHLTTSTSDYYLIAAPTAGVWRAYQNSANEGQLTVSAESSINFEYIGDTTLAHGRSSPLLAYLSGIDPSLVFTLVNATDNTSVPISMYDDGSHGDFESGDGIFGGTFTPNDIAVYHLAVTGQTESGDDFHRVSPVGIQVLTLDISVSGTIAAKPGETVIHRLEITNRGTTVETFGLSAQSSSGWADLGLMPTSIDLDVDESFALDIPVMVPDSAALGDSDILVFNATSVDDPRLADTASTATIADPIELPDQPLINEIDNPGESGSYSVSWLAVDSATGYELQESHDSGSWLDIYTGSDTTILLTGRSDGVWCYRVRAFNDKGEGEWSETTCTTVVNIVDQPLINEIDNPGESGSYSVSWLAVDSATGYELQESYDSGSWLDIYTGSDTTILLTGRSDGVWCYRVRAFNDKGEGEWSETTCTTVVNKPLFYRIHLPLVIQ